MAVSTTESVSKNASKTSNVKWPEEWGKVDKVFVPIEDGDDSPVQGCLNGKNWKIPRGEWTEAPEAVRAIIAQSQEILSQSKKRNKKFEDGDLNLS